VSSLVESPASLATADATVAARRAATALSLSGIGVADFAYDRPAEPVGLPCLPERTQRDAAPRVAIVHEWLDNYAGSERVLEQLIACFPHADLFATVDFLPENERGFLHGRDVHTSFIQRLPFSRRLFRKYLGLMPIAVQQFDMGGYDVIISSNHAVAKAVLTGPDQTHISYTHSPMRYAWDLQHQYLRQANLEHGLRGAYAKWQLARLRQWDVSASVGVDYFVANSRYIARRIRKAYRRDAVVIHPPVDIENFSHVRTKDDFFLLACRFVPYKRADVVVAAFAQDKRRRLVVVGDGPERARIRELARGAPNIELRGLVPQAELIDFMQRARALVFAGEEDFGISMVEAQACGTPVIAFGRGGARDIVLDPETDDPTGLFFERQEPNAVASAVTQFETLEARITSTACRANALRFSPVRFRSEITRLVDTALRSPLPAIAL
jgi:glycosyltransferase involved in cell wall biosynthesis